jgi:branched-chain amino acid aminotransferase
MAKIEAIQAGCDEGIMLNEQGYVAECTGDNVFIIKDGTVFTPAISSGALDGITRRAVMELITGKLGLTCREVTMTRFDVYTADECFLTGTAAEVIPVVEYDRRPIGAGKPGPVSVELVRLFKELANAEGAAVSYS